VKIKKIVKIVSAGLIGTLALALAFTAVAQTPPSGPLNLIEETAQQAGPAAGTQRSLPEIIGNIIQWVLGLIGVVLLIMFIYGGVLYATSAGNEEKIETGKKVMLYAIIGVVIIALAFALTRYVIQALFKQP
jgi:heme/copper-type cytochrome/quinol oxidase subunit 2